MTDRYHGWPQFLREVAEHMGSGEGALRLAETLGGQRVSVPLEARAGNAIAQACGLDVERALVALRAGENVEIPLAGSDRLKKTRIAKLEGSANAVARAAGCTSRYARKIKNAPPPPMPLFDGDE